MAQQNMNQPNNKRKNSPENVPGSGEDPKKKNKFNIYWIYGLVFLSIIAYNMYRGVNSTGVETDQQKFYEMLKQGDVDKIKTIRNKKLVRIFLNKDSLNNKAGIYSLLLNDAQDDKKYDAAKKTNQPQAYFNIKDMESFSREMSEFYTQNPQIKHISDNPDEEGELFSQIISTLLPILLIGFLFVLMMRKVGGPGGGGGPGGIFNIGKSKATLFEK
ncbi:MAG: AAA family ATPase, partial [Ferruginibacter sp.]|nr:AAA family ATPase [Ferruginibacter sp.]